MLPVVTATDLYRYVEDPFGAWCDRHAPSEARDPLTPAVEMLFRKGREHEARLVAARYPDAVALPDGPREERFRATLDAMAAGARVLHGATLLDEAHGMQGEADLLERRDDAPSRFGPWHYVVKEVKSARNIRDAHRLQAAYYHKLVSLAQGTTPATFSILDRDGNEHVFVYDEPELDALLRAVRAVHAGEARPDPVHGASAWPWESYADRLAAERRDVSLVTGVGPVVRAALFARGIATVGRLAGCDEAELRAIRGIGPAKARRYAAWARALETKRHLRLADPEVPEGRTEVFLDLEGTSEQEVDDVPVSIDYLIGCLVRRDGKEEYVPFVAHALDGERDMFHAFASWVATLDEPVLYHWHHYEATHLRLMAKRHGLDPALEAALFPRLHDLHKSATAAYAFPVTGTSLKRIAPYMGFRWSQSDVNAMESIALYLDYARDPAANREQLDKVVAYNRDDCVATRVVKDWLAQRPA